MTRRGFAALAFAAALTLLLAAPSTAAAFPWMVKHGYSTCGQCHSDPSGAGVLTAYGRAQGEIILRTPWGTRSDEWEPGAASKPAFGILPVPQSLDIGFSSRSAQLVVEPEEGEGDERFLQMQTDLRAHYRAGKVRLYASAGASKSDRTDPVRLTKNDDKDAVNLTSREHWAGFEPVSGVLVRGGRMVLPYGVRQIEHYLWVREATRTDLDSTSQHGVSASWTGTSARAELMAVAGNLTLSPDDYRERGYSGMAEYAITQYQVVGVSSMVLHAEADLAARVPVNRMAHGVFARLSPHHMVAILGEVDALRTEVEGQGATTGYVGMLQADIEPIQGVHVVLTGETFRPDTDGLDPLLGGWASLVWYFAPHMDARIDAVHRTFPVGDDDRTSVDLYLFQFHFYL
jgi:hypothetical protein